MRFDAIVLSGGRSSRLGGSPKHQLVVGGRSLLETTLRAVGGASRTVVVGDEPLRADIFGAADAAVPPFFVREEPRFAGPAAAIAAGVAALAAVTAEDAAFHGEPAEFTIVVACDMPNVAGAIAALLAEADSVRDSPSISGFVAADEDGTAQLLVGLYRTSALVDAIGQLAEGLVNLSVRRLVSGLELEAVAVPVGSTHDIDTWADAAEFGVTAAPTEGEPR